MIMFRLFVLKVAALLLHAGQPAFAAGDPEYGEYLSSECVTCHQAKPGDGKIPHIHGMDGEGMVHILKLYRSGELENPAMQTVAKRLTDEDIEALAAYFSSLPTVD